MLKKILSISGKSGLYRLISYGNNIIVVEGLTDKKRIPAYSNYKIISLGDIAIYTTGEEVPLANVLDAIYKKYEGKTLDAAMYKTAEQLQTFFSDRIQAMILEHYAFSSSNFFMNATSASTPAFGMAL